MTNNQAGFDELYSKIQSCNDEQIRVDLEATGHYSYLLSKDFKTFVFNPLQTKKFRESV
ncbi:MAG: transposase [Selenomonadaceae bacterium]|nr:transposase [Selenomonadaceae bacterium]